MSGRVSRTRAGRARWAAGAALAAVALLAGAAGLSAQLRYGREYPTIPYEAGPTTDAVSRFWEQVSSGRTVLEHEEQRGYLASLLRALDVPVESQALVFTRTSLQKGLISPRTPRAIYFNDDVYVAWIPGTRQLEIAALDPMLGAVFYTIDQAPGAAPRLDRQTAFCLQCHDTYGLTGGGVPELLTGSMLPDAQGNAVYHEGWIATTHETPLARRWGGWYVTGTHGEQTHLGNVYVEDPSRAAALDFRASGNVTDLAGRFDTGSYLSGHSDIVALMVFEHQILVQNRIIRLNYRLRAALHAEGVQADVAAAPASDAVQRVLETEGEELVRALLLSGEAPLTAPVRGTSGFAERFAARGPRDPSGRSLRELDLERRMFRYPLSYLVYSEAFDALPELGRRYVARRLGEVLGGDDRSEPFEHLTDADRRAVLEILTATKPSFAELVREGMR